MADQIVTNIDLLKENDRLRCELVAHIAHDLGGPVTAIQGFSETLLLKAPQLGEAERSKYTQVIHLNARMLAKLIAELFDLSRLEAREIVPECEPFSIEALVNDVASRFKPSFEDKQISFEFSSPSHLPFVLADIALVERVLSNLFENALRYTDRGGRIAVNFEEMEGLLAVTVRDNGIGIPDEDQAFIFDSFYRVNKDRSRTSGGAGLGLAIVKKIIGAHGCSVSLFSRLGKGTEIRFSLPIASN